MNLLVLSRMRKFLALLLMVLFLCACLPVQAAIDAKKKSLPTKSTKKITTKQTPKKKAKAVKSKNKKSAKPKKTAAKPLPKKTPPAAKQKKKSAPPRSSRSTEEAWSFEMTSEEAVASSEAMKKDGGKKLWFEMGGRVGLFAAANGIFGELRFPLSRVVGPATTSLRLSGGFAQDEETSRRYVPVGIDGILNFPAGYITGVDNYLGVGLNYLALTTGRVAGSFGGQAFYGVEGSGFGGKMFGELGYGFMRASSTSAQKGITLTVGYRK